MAENESRNLGAGGLSPRVEQGTRMHNYASLFKLQHQLYTIGNIRLWRELTVYQLAGGLVAFAVAFFLASFLLDGMYAFFAGIGAAVGMVRLIALSEDWGRNPLLEARAFLVFTVLHPHFFVGARPVGQRYGTGPEQKRLKQMIARERSLSSGTEFKSSWQILSGNLLETYRSIRRGGV